MDDRAAIDRGRHFQQRHLPGRDLQALGASGPRIGELLSALLDRVLDDPALNTREALLAIAREMK